MKTDVQRHVTAAVAEILPMLGASADMNHAVHAALWPYVVAAVLDIAPTDTIPTATDRRTRPWRYVVRFWKRTDTGLDLVGETDPSIMMGTGEIATILQELTAEMHGAVPEAINEGQIRARLPQFRNNLGRGTSATLRIEYHALEGAHIAQMDVYRLES